MEYVLVALGVVCIIAGLAGSILPGIPGPPLGYLGLLLIHWTRFAQYSVKMLVFWAIVVLIVAVLDYIVPIWGTKKYGGTRAGVIGSTIGLIAGVILLPILGITLGPLGLFGILGGPFLGAWIGELSAGKDSGQALRAAFGSFIGFLAGTVMKLVVSLILGYYFFKELVQTSLPSQG